MIYYENVVDVAPLIYIYIYISLKDLALYLLLHWTIISYMIMEDIKDVILIEIWKYDYLVDLVFYGNHDSNNLLGSWFLVFIVFFF